MRANLRLEISAAELKAVAKYNDTIESTANGIAIALGREVGSIEITNLDKLEMALGGTKKFSGSYNEVGLVSQYEISSLNQG